jgi:NAD(P)H-dependent FMN reductase
VHHEKEHEMIIVGIILGSTRPGRNGEAVARWVADIVSARSDAQYELVDLKAWGTALKSVRQPAPQTAWREPSAHTT